MSTLALGTTLAHPNLAHAEATRTTHGDSATSAGGYHYPACGGPLTWSLAIDQNASAVVDAQREAVLWQEAFAEAAALTGYSFEQVPPDASSPTASSATITIEYRAAAPYGEELAHGGITRVDWDGSGWTAAASAITVYPDRLATWERALGSADIRAWVARHELAHALGLGHSHRPSSLMATRYQPDYSPTRFTGADFTDLNPATDVTCPR